MEQVLDMFCSGLREVLLAVSLMLMNPLYIN